MRQQTGDQPRQRTDDPAGQAVAERQIGLERLAVDRTQTGIGDLIDAQYVFVEEVQGRAAMRRLIAQHRRIDRAGEHAAHLDTGTGQLLAERDQEAAQPEFGGAVGRAAGQRDQRRRRHDRQDAAAAPGRHAARRRLRQPHRRQQIDADMFFQFAIRQVGDIAGPDDPGVVDQQRQPRLGFDQGGNPFQICMGCQICAYRLDLGRKPRGARIETVLIEIDQDQAIAASQKSLCQG
ncbi:MAG: hypothetical protein WDN69_25550 [Aliidongia sp.]